MAGEIIRYGSATGSVLGDLPPAPWDRQPGEPAKEYEAFRSYRDQVPPRAISRVYGSQGLRVPTQQAHQWLGQWGWLERARAYDQHLAKVLEGEREEGARLGGALLAERQLKTLATALEIAEIEFDKLYAEVCAFPNTRILKPDMLMRLLDRVITLQRLVHGETTENIKIEDSYDFSNVDLDDVKKMRETLIKARKT